MKLAYVEELYSIDNPNESHGAQNSEFTDWTKRAINPHYSAFFHRIYTLTCNDATLSKEKIYDKPGITLVHELDRSKIEETLFFVKNPKGEEFPVSKTTRVLDLERSNYRNIDAECNIFETPAHLLHPSVWSGLHHQQPHAPQIRTRLLRGEEVHRFVPAILLTQKIYPPSAKNLPSLPTTNYIHDIHPPSNASLIWTEEILSSTHINSALHPITIYTDASVIQPDKMQPLPGSNDPNYNNNLSPNLIGLSIIFSNETDNHHIPWIQRDVYAIRIQGLASDMCSYDAELLAATIASSLRKITPDHLHINIVTDCQGLVNKIKNIRSKTDTHWSSDNIPPNHDLHLHREGLKNNALIKTILNNSQNLTLSFQPSHVEKRKSDPNTFSTKEMGNYIADAVAGGREHIIFPFVRSIKVIDEIPLAKISQDNSSLTTIRVHPIDSPNTPFLGSANRIQEIINLNRYTKYIQSREDNYYGHHRLWKHIDFPLAGEAFAAIDKDASKSILDKHGIGWRQLRRIFYRLTNDKFQNNYFKSKIQDKDCSNNRKELPNTLEANDIILSKIIIHPTSDQEGMDDDLHTHIMKYPPCPCCTQASANDTILPLKDSITHILFECSNPEISKSRSTTIANLLATRSQLETAHERKVLTTIIQHLGMTQNELLSSKDSRSWAGAFPKPLIDDCLTQCSPIALKKIVLMIIKQTLPAAHNIWKQYCHITHQTPDDKVNEHHPPRRRKHKPRTKQSPQDCDHHVQMIIDKNDNNQLTLKRPSESTAVHAPPPPRAPLFVNQEIKVKPLKQLTIQLEWQRKISKRETRNKAWSTLTKPPSPTKVQTHITCYNSFAPLDNPNLCYHDTSRYQLIKCNHEISKHRILNDPKRHEAQQRQKQVAEMRKCAKEQTKRGLETQNLRINQIKKARNHEPPNPSSSTYLIFQTENTTIHPLFQITSESLQLPNNLSIDTIEIIHQFSDKILIQVPPDNHGHSLLNSINVSRASITMSQLSPQQLYHIINNHFIYDETGREQFEQLPEAIKTTILTEVPNKNFQSNATLIATLIALNINFTIYDISDPKVIKRSSLSPTMQNTELPPPTEISLLRNCSQYGALIPPNGSISHPLSAEDIISTGFIYTTNYTPGDQYIEDLFENEKFPADIRSPVLGNSPLNTINTIPSLYSPNPLTAAIILVEYPPAQHDHKNKIFLRATCPILRGTHVSTIHGQLHRLNSAAELTEHRDWILIAPDLAINTSTIGSIFSSTISEDEGNTHITMHYDPLFKLRVLILEATEHIPQNEIITVNRQRIQQWNQFIQSSAPTSSLSPFLKESDEEVLAEGAGGQRFKTCQRHGQGYGQSSRHHHNQTPDQHNQDDLQCQMASPLSKLRRTKSAKETKESKSCLHLRSSIAQSPQNSTTRIDNPHLPTLYPPSQSNYELKVTKEAEESESPQVPYDSCRLRPRLNIPQSPLKPSCPETNPNPTNLYPHHCVAPHCLSSKAHDIDYHPLSPTLPDHESPSAQPKYVSKTAKAPHPEPSPPLYKNIPDIAKAENSLSISPPSIIPSQTHFPQAPAPHASILHLQHTLIPSSPFYTDPTCNNLRPIIKYHSPNNAVPCPQSNPCPYPLSESTHYSPQTPQTNFYLSPNTAKASSQDFPPLSSPPLSLINSRFSPRHRETNVPPSSSTLIPSSLNHPILSDIPVNHHPLSSANYPFLNQYPLSSIIVPSERQACFNDLPPLSSLLKSSPTDLSLPLHPNVSNVKVPLKRSFLQMFLHKMTPPMQPPRFSSPSRKLKNQTRPSSTKKTREPSPRKKPTVPSILHSSTSSQSMTLTRSPPPVPQVEPSMKPGPNPQTQAPITSPSAEATILPKKPSYLPPDDIIPQQQVRVKRSRSPCPSPPVPINKRLKPADEVRKERKKVS